MLWLLSNQGARIHFYMLKKLASSPNIESNILFLSISIIRMIGLVKLVAGVALSSLQV
jgi:hypothetical protein